MELDDAGSTPPSNVLRRTNGESSKSAPHLITDQKVSIAHTECPSNTQSETIKLPIETSQQSIPRIFIHPPQSARSLQLTLTSQIPKAGAATREDLDLNVSPTIKAEKSGQFLDLARVDNLRRRGESEYYELLDAEGHSRRRSMIREVSEDDYLVVRGANPRTGLVTPAKLSIDESAAGEIAAANAKTRLNGPKWRQTKDQWITVNNLDVSQNVDASAHFPATLVRNELKSSSSSSPERIVEANQRETTAFAIKKPSRNPNDISKDETHSESYLKTSSPKNDTSKHSTNDDIYSVYGPKIKRKQISRPEMHRLGSTEERLTQQTTRNDDYMGKGFDKRSPHASTSLDQHHVRPNVSNGLPRFYLPPSQPNAKLSFKPDKESDLYQHSPDLKFVEDPEKLTFDERNRDLHQSCLDKQLPDLPTESGQHQPCRMATAPEGKATDIFHANHWRPTQPLVQFTQHLPPGNSYNPPVPIGSTPQEQEQIQRQGQQLDLRLPVMANAAQTQHNSTRIAPSSKVEACKILSPQIPSSKISQRTQGVALSSPDQDVFTTIPTITNISTAPSHRKDNTNIPTMHTYRDQGRDSPSGSLNRRKQATTACQQTELTNQLLSNVMIPSGGPSYTVHQPVLSETVNKHSVPEALQHYVRTLPLMHMDKHLQSSMTGIATKKNISTNSTRPLPIEEIQVLTNFQMRAPNPYNIQRHLTEQNIAQNATKQAIGLENRGQLGRIICGQRDIEKENPVCMTGSTTTRMERRISVGANAPEPLANLTILDQIEAVSLTKSANDCLLGHHDNKASAAVIESITDNTHYTAWNPKISPSGSFLLYTEAMEKAGGHGFNRVACSADDNRNRQRLSESPWSREEHVRSATDVSTPHKSRIVPLSHGTGSLSKAKKKLGKLPSMALSLKPILGMTSRSSASSTDFSVSDDNLFDFFNSAAKVGKSSEFVQTTGSGSTSLGAVAAARKAIELQSSPSQFEGIASCELHLPRRRPRKLPEKSEHGQPISISSGSQQGYSAPLATRRKQRVAANFDEAVDDFYHIRNLTPLTGWTQMTSKRQQNKHTEIARITENSSIRPDSDGVWQSLAMKRVMISKWMSQNPRVVSGFWFFLQAYWRALLEVLSSNQRLATILIVYSRTGVIKFDHRSTPVSLAKDVVKNILYTLVLVSIVVFLVRITKLVLLPVWALLWSMRVVFMIISTTANLLVGNIR